MDFPRKSLVQEFLPCYFRSAATDRRPECSSAEPASAPTQRTLSRACSTQKSNRRISSTCFAPPFRRGTHRMRHHFSDNEAVAVYDKYGSYTCQIAKVDKLLVLIMRTTFVLAL